MDEDGIAALDEMVKDFDEIIAKTLAAEEANDDEEDEEESEEHD